MSQKRQTSIVLPAGLKPATPILEVSCSFQLSYGSIFYMCRWRGSNSHRVSPHHILSVADIPDSPTSAICGPGRTRTVVCARKSYIFYMLSLNLIFMALTCIRQPFNAHIPLLFHFHIKDNMKTILKCTCTAIPIIFETQSPSDVSFPHLVRKLSD